MADENVIFANILQAVFDKVSERDKTIIAKDSAIAELQRALEHAEEVCKQEQEDGSDARDVNVSLAKELAELQEQVIELRTEVAARQQKMELVQKTLEKAEKRIMQFVEFMYSVRSRVAEIQTTSAKIDSKTAKPEMLVVSTQVDTKLNELNRLLTESHEET